MIRPKFVVDDQQNEMIKINPRDQSQRIEHQSLFQINGEQSRVELSSKQKDSQIRKKSYTNQTTVLSNNSKTSQPIEKHHLDIHNQDINYQHSLLEPNQQIHSSKGNSYLTVPEVARARKKSTSYEQKVDMFHKGTASQVKPNMLLSAQNGSASPVLQNYSNYSFKPQESGQPYDPYDERIRTKKIKIQSRIASSKRAIKAEQLPLQKASKNNLDQIISENSSKVAFAQYQSTVIVDKSQEIANFKINPFSQEKIQESLKSVLSKVESVTEFQFMRQKKCFVNYMNPDFKILRKDGSVAIAAKKQSCHFNSYYHITVSQAVIGCLRGNFGGTEFNLYRLTGNEQELVATIAYEANFACGSDFRKMEVYIKESDSNDLVFAREAKKKDLKQLYNDGYKQNIKRLITKEPKWCQLSNCFTLNFKGKGKLPSIKNMILVADQKAKSTNLVFCKREANSFFLQIDPSLSIFVTMGILMSSFDFKLFCQ